MDQAGMLDFEQFIVRSLNIFGIEETADFYSHKTRKIEKNLLQVTQCLCEVTQQKNPFISIELEKHCINFESAFFATTEQEQKRYDKQLSELQSAKASAKLVFEPEAYRQHVLDAYGPHRKIMFPPAGEACVTVLQKHIQQLARPKTGIVSPTIKEFYSARQANLRAAREACIEAQCTALGIPFPRQKQVGLSLEK